MKFSKLAIRNYRSIPESGVELIFPDSSNIIRVVGPNGCGKSNVISALGHVLGIYPFRRREISETDFHETRTDRDLCIELTLREPLLDRDVYQQVYEVWGFRFRAWRKARGDGKGVLTTEHHCLDRDGKTILKSQRIFKKKVASDDDLDNSKLPVWATDHAWKLGEAYFLDPGSLDRFFDSTTGSGPLARLLEQYRDDFPADHNSVELGKETVPARIALERLSRKLVEILRTALLSRIESSLAGHFSTYLGQPRDHGSLAVGMGLPTHRELFDELLALKVREHASAVPLGADSLGGGYRALLRLAVVESLAEFSERKLILLVEEPESYLHVHLGRYFARVLARLAESGHQIVLSTHSPSFIDLTTPETIVRLQKKSGSTVLKQVRRETQFDFRAAKRKLLESGNEELVFAYHAVLTEGRDDKAVVETVLRTIVGDIDVHGVSVIDCNSANNLPDYVRLCGELGIDFFVVHDMDDPANPAQARRNERIGAAVAEMGPSLPAHHGFAPHLEATLGQAHHCGVERLLDVLDRAGAAEAPSRFPELWNPLMQFATSRGLVRSTSQVSGAGT